MEQNYRIYCYTNLVTGKKYVGQTCQTLAQRARKEGIGYRHCTYFYTAIQKYGWENFVGEILEDGLTLEQANEREEYWIKELNTIVPFGYNILKGGDNHEVHEVTRQRLSEVLKGEGNPFFWKTSFR